MGFRSMTDIRTSAIAFIDARLSGCRTESGEPIVDLIDATATEEGRFYTLAEYLRRINSIAGWQSIVSDDSFKQTLATALGVSATTLNPVLAQQLGVSNSLPSDIEAIIYFDLNRFADSFGQGRRAATFATSSERFYLSSSAPYTLLKGGAVKTSGTNAVSYTTVDDQIGIVPGFDPVANSYFVDVGIVCQTAGSAGNQVTGAIKSSSNLPSVVRVTNTIPAQGGLPEETNTQLLNRLSGSFTGTDIDSLNGLLTFVKNQTDVFDAIVVGPGDPLMVRAVAGAVDIYIIGSRLVTTTMSVIIEIAGESLLLQYQPLNQFNSAQDITNPATFVPGSGLILQPDTGNFSGSSKANDSLVWDPITGPQPGDQVLVHYTYNGVLRDLQLQFDGDPTKNIPASDILVKLAGQLFIVMSMQVIIVPGQTQSTVEQAVLNTLNQLLSSYTLAQELDFSVVETAAQATQVDGINAVDHINNLQFAVLGSSLDTANVTPVRNQYVRLYSINFISDAGTVS